MLSMPPTSHGCMGQPTHAFDLDKIEGGNHRPPRHKGEKLKTLDGVEALLILRTLSSPTMPKLSPSVASWRLGHHDYPSTTNVLVEAAWFEPWLFRRTARRHGLHTDGEPPVRAGPTSCSAGCFGPRKQHSPRQRRPYRG